MGFLKRKVSMRAYAKINYALDVLRIRPDGYHEIASVMQNISLADEVEIEHSGEGFALHVEPEGVEVGSLEKNTVFRSWCLLCERIERELPVTVRLRKRIPAGSGLGGASTDAAAALHGINELFGLGLSAGELREIGVKVGADVPFCLSGGTALGEGVGEILTPLPAPPAHWLLIVKPPRGAMTAEVYRRHDGAPWESVSSVQAVVEAIKGGNLDALARSIGNGLAPVTRKLAPEVESLERELCREGALGAMMTGSGTAVYGIFGSREAAESARKKLRAHFVEVCEPVENAGARIFSR